MDLLNKIKNRSATVGVIGLGYVGLPLVIQFVKAGFTVIGFDLDEEKIKCLEKGKSYIKHIPAEEKAREFDFHTKFIELAGEINTHMPYYVVQKTVDTLNQKGISIKGAKVLVLGIAYKKNVDDMRESHTD